MDKEEDYYKKLALHRYIFETKFGGDSILDLSIAKFISEILNDNLTLIIRTLESEGKSEEVQEWEQWRILTKNRREFLLISKAIDKYQEKIINPDETKEENTERLKNFISMLASPFTLTDEIVEALLDFSVL